MQANSPLHGALGYVEVARSIFLFTSSNVAGQDAKMVLGQVISQIHTMLSMLIKVSGLNHWCMIRCFCGIQKEIHHHKPEPPSNNGFLWWVSIISNGQPWQIAPWGFVVEIYHITTKKRFCGNVFNVLRVKLPNPILWGVMKHLGTRCCRFCFGRLKWVDRRMSLPAPLGSWELRETTPKTKVFMYIIYTFI